MNMLMLPLIDVLFFAAVMIRNARLINYLVAKQRSSGGYENVDITKTSYGHLVTSPEMEGNSGRNPKTVKGVFIIYKIISSGRRMLSSGI
jgi:hypothetical protein